MLGGFLKYKFFLPDVTRGERMRVNTVLHVAVCDFAMFS
jgi:hypothetical protein